MSDLLRLLQPALLGLLLAACAGSGDATRPDPREDSTSSVVDFRLKNLKGATQALTALRGKVVLVSFWATWCEPCQIELSRLQEVWRELAPRGFELISVCVDPADSEGAVRNLVRRQRYEFPVLLDQDSRVAERFNPTLDLPYGMLLDRQGRVSSRHQGYQPGDELTLRKEIEELLAK